MRKRIVVSLNDRYLENSSTWISWNTFVNDSLSSLIEMNTEAKQNGVNEWAVQRLTSKLEIRQVRQLKNHIHSGRRNNSVKFVFKKGGVVDTVRDPLLIIAFNRPNHLAQLIERLRETKPARIYVAVDGPRLGNASDSTAVCATRKLVSSIDWTTDVHTLFQESNLGCGLGVSTAIDWFFSSEDRGIILEDDILPQQSFFAFCSELLDRYSNDPDVLAISGCNFVPPDFISGRSAYRFSRVPHIWGWATWKDKWAIHELDISNWHEQMPLRKLWEVSGRSLAALVFWRSIFNRTASGEIDTWDMQLVLAGMARNMYTATSNVNLIENIGFDGAATHTEIRPHFLRTSENVHLPTSPIDVVVDEKADAWSRKTVFGATIRGLISKGLRHRWKRLRTRI